MRITIGLPDNIQALSDEEQKKQNKRSKWADIAKRVENDPVHLGEHTDQFKRDMKEFRDNFEFKHDLH